MQSIADLVAEHMDAEARELFTLVTNSTVEDLVEYLATGRDELNPNGHGGAACMRFLSSDRFIHDVQGNILGLHVLRSMLAPSPWLLFPKGAPYKLPIFRAKRLLKKGQERLPLRDPQKEAAL